MGSARDGTGLYRILMSRGCRSVSNFYVDLAILAARRGAGACGDPARPRIETPPNSRFLSGNALVPPGMSADEWRLVMLDAIYLAVGLGFLAVAVLYVVACDRI